MHIVPDLLPHIDPRAEVKLSFGRRKIRPGEFVDSRLSEYPGKLDIQTFEKGEKLVSIAFMDPDVPDMEHDTFVSRCHYLASNISISPTNGVIRLRELPTSSDNILPWLPPFAQKGSPYHRIAVFVLEQANGQVVDASSLKAATKREGFSLRGLCSKHKLHPIGMHLFRTQWDEGTAGVMQRAGLGGSDIEFRRKRVEPLPYKKKDGERYR